LGSLWETHFRLPAGARKPKERFTFRESQSSIRNDGVTGSSPVSGTIHGRGRKAPWPLQLHRRMNEKKRKRGPAFARERCGSARRVAK